MLPPAMRMEGHFPHRRGGEPGVGVCLRALCVISPTGVGVNLLPEDIEDVNAAFPPQAWG